LDGKQLDRGVQICEIRPLARGPFFEVVNLSADFSALEAECRNYMGIGHPPNLGADQIHFLWQLRHNTGNFSNLGLVLRFSLLIDGHIQTLAAKFPSKWNREFF
jgi:hypothetical protein